MTQSITNAITEIATVVESISGIQAPSATPSDNASEYPFAMVYEIAGDIGPMSQGWTEGLHSIAIDVLVPREWDLSVSLPILHPILDALGVALYSETAKDGATAFNGSIDTFGNLRIEFLPTYNYNNIEMIGYRLTMEQVKIITIL